MKILFIQLPLLDHSQGYLLGNFEYASASLAAYLKKHFTSRVETYLLPRSLSLFGSDDIILRYCKNLEPDIVSFTCYLWNIERSMFLAERIKQEQPACTVFFGGPEIAQGSIALRSPNPHVDCFVSGEGEWFFDQVMRREEWKRNATLTAGNTTVFQPDDALIDTGMIVEPFNAKYLNPMPDGSIFIEMTRGCPYRCSYCYYSKNCSRVRELPVDVLLRTMNERSNLTEIYILSPTFDRTVQFADNLKLLAKINRGISLHTEMRADRINPETASLIRRAGFKSLEVGLQTLNKKALERIRRGSDPDRELEGMVMLKNAGIDLKIGIIPGLPGDTPEAFTKTIDRLVEAGLGDNIELYPLMILPGTSIRDSALSDGVDFIDAPPYFYLSGWGFDSSALKEIIWYSESKTGFSHIQRRLPDFTRSGKNGLCRGVHLRGDNAGNWDFSRWAHLVDTSVFTLFVTLTRSDSLLKGIHHLTALFARNELFNVVFYYDGLFNDADIVRVVSSMDRDSFYRRLHHFDQWTDGLPFRLYQVMSDFGSFRKAHDAYKIVEPILCLTPGNLVLIENSVLDECNVLIPDGSYGSVRDFLVMRYSDMVELVAFENETEQKAFYDEIGFEHISFPYSYRIIDLN